MKKFTPYYQINFNEELLTKLEDDVKLTPKKMIFAYCNMLIHKVCPSEENLQEHTKDMYDIVLSLFEDFRREIEGKDLLEAFYKLDKVHEAIHQIPQTKRFEEKLKEMITEIENAINTNQQKEIFCFDVTEEFRVPQQPQREDREVVEEDKYAGYQKIPEEPVKVERKKSFKFPMKKMAKVSLQNKFAYQKEKARKIEAFFEGVFSVILPLLLTTWSICRVHLFPHLFTFLIFLSKKIVKKVKSMKIWRNTKAKFKSAPFRVKSSVNAYMSVPLTTRFSNTINGIVKFWKQDKRDVMYPNEIKFTGKKLFAAISQFLLFIFLLSLTFCFIFGGQESHQFEESPTPAQPEVRDYQKEYILENAERYHLEVRKLEDQKDQNYKDLKYIKTELDWLHHKLEKYEARGDSLSTSDLEDLSLSVDKALKKFDR